MASLSDVWAGGYIILVVWLVVNEMVVCWVWIIILGAVVISFFFKQVHFHHCWPQPPSAPPSSSNNCSRLQKGSCPFYLKTMDLLPFLHFFANKTFYLLSSPL